MNPNLMPMSTKRQQERARRFWLSDGSPKYVRCYDNGGESCDRYTAVFTGRYRMRTGGEFLYVGMSGEPFHPQGFCQHGGSLYEQIDWHGFAHIGKRIAFSALPADCQEVVLQDYIELWDLEHVA